MVGFENLVKIPLPVSRAPSTLRRVVAELRGSVTLDQLNVARTYGELFVKQLRDYDLLKTSTGVDRMLTKIYLVERERFD